MKKKKNKEKSLNDKNDNDVFDKDWDITEEENYKIKNKLCKNLSKLFSPSEIENNQEEYTMNDKKCWKPPKVPGLDNCNYIIPKYYHKDYEKILDIEYYSIIMDDIKNMRPLNNYQLEFIQTLDNSEAYKIIVLMNDCVKSLVSVLNDI